MMVLFRYVTDSTAAILVCVSCFMWPRERPDLFWWRKLGKLDDNGERAPPQPLVTWRCVESKVPWGLILLLGGGLALADSISVIIQPEDPYTYTNLNCI